MIDYDATFVNTNGSPFPDTEAINVSAPGAGDGTEFVAAMVNDIWGRAQALMDYAGLTADGVQDDASRVYPDISQNIEALWKGLGVGPGVGVTYWKNDTPAVWGDRVLLLQGQEIAIATYPYLFDAVYCGDADNATAPAFYATNGAGVRTTPGAGGTHFVLPDHRGLSPKMIGNATVNGRTKTGPVELGEKQEDQGQGHRHSPLSVISFLNRVAAGGGWAIPGAGATMTETTSTGDPVTDGVHIPLRTGDTTRDSTLGTNFGITY
jgi:hypothetical protein